jgi:YVTN family beta-propeller protein
MRLRKLLLALAIVGVILVGACVPTLTTAPELTLTPTPEPTQTPVSTSVPTEDSVPYTYYEMDIPHEVTVRPGGKELYATGITSALVLVIDIDSPDYPILGGIELPGGEVIGHPDIVFSHDGKYAYMARHHNEEFKESWGLQDASYIVVINCEKREIDHIIPMQSYVLAGSLVPSPDDRWLYFTTWPNATSPVFGIAKLDLRSQEVVGLVPLNSGNGIPFITISINGKHIYATQGEIPPGSGGNIFYDIDAERLEVVSFLEVGDGARSIAVTPDGQKAYVSNRWTNDLSVINLETMEVATTIIVGPEPREIVITPDGNKAYVALPGVTPMLEGLPGYEFGRHVAVVDIEQDVLLKTIEVHFDPESVSIHPDGTRVFVADGGANGPDPLNGPAEFHVIDATNDVCLGRVILRPAARIGPAGIDITPDNSKLFITSFPRGSLIAIDIATGGVVGELNIEPRAVKVSADGFRVYVFSPASPEHEANLYIIDTDSLEIINSIGLGRIGSAVASPMPSFRIVLNKAETIVYINYETHIKCEGSTVDWVDPDDTGLVAVDLVAGEVAAKIFYSESTDVSMKGMALVPDETKLLISDPPTATVVIIDTSTNLVIDRVPVVNHPLEIKISQDGKRAYVLQQFCATVVTVIDIDTHEVVENIEAVGVHGQYDFELSPDECYAYVMGMDMNHVMVYNLQDHRLEKLIGTGLDPFNSTSTPDMKYIYISKITDDKVIVLDTTTNSVVRIMNLGELLE